jgi:hypothetical protein
MSRARALLALARQQARALVVLQRQRADLLARCGGPALLLRLPTGAHSHPAAAAADGAAWPTTTQPRRWYAYAQPPPPSSNDDGRAKEDDGAAQATPAASAEPVKAPDGNDDQQALPKNDDDDDDDDESDANDANDDEEDEESEHRIHAFAAGGGPMRAKLEAWLVAMCLAGTTYEGSNGGGGGHGGCTFLTLAPRPQLAPLVWAQGLLLSLTSPMRRALERRGEALVQAAVERDFSAREFCDGCGGAFEAAMRFYGLGRWDVLSGMASPAVVGSMRAAWDDLKRSRGLEPARVTARVSRVSLAAPNVWRRSAVARLDPARAVDGGGAGGGGVGGSVPWFAALAVEVEAQVDVALAAAGWREEARARRRAAAADEAEEEEEEGEGEGEGGGGGGGEEEEEDDDDLLTPDVVVETSSTRRVGYLVFARGPLPRSPAPTLYSPWWLVGWY